MNKRSLITITILLLIWIDPTLARTYRWVDENGVTIYSQSPPPSGKATIIKTPPPSSSSKPGETLEKLRARLNEVNESNKKKSEAKAKEKKAAEDTETNQRICESAKKHLAYLEQSGRIKKKMEDGNYKILAEEEKTAEMDKTREAISEYCK